MSEPAAAVTVQRDRKDLHGKLIVSEPYPIYLFENRQFGALREKEWVFGGTIRTVEKKMAKVRRCIKVFSTNGVEPCVVEEISEFRDKKYGRGDLFRRDGSKSDLRWNEIYEYDAKIIGQLNALADEEAAMLERHRKEEEAMQKRREKLCEKAKEIELHEVNKIVAERGVLYDETAQG